ncbi:Hypothetical protein PHPALM_17224 [Phytophthora palmivora]|uniref:Uncharacterized protein n=1 Tax=Phytophthora palmivora TaxID=4796 RepID=A0A2P4XMR5_9STRA|nr:Hypothetical protein PHPALM_17224 [Phytophthora palmivora]
MPVRRPRNHQRGVVAQGGPPSSVATGFSHATAGGIANLDPGVAAQIASVGPALKAIELRSEDNKIKEEERNLNANLVKTLPAEEEEAMAGDRDKSDKKNGKINLRNTSSRRSEVKQTVFKAFLTDMTRLSPDRFCSVSTTPTMVDALEGGNTQRANVLCALVVLVRNAYPKYTDFLETTANLEGEDPERKPQAAIAVLSRKAGTGGRLPDRTKNKAKPHVRSAVATGKTKAKARTPPPRIKTQTNPETSKKRVAEANTAVVERKNIPKRLSIESMCGTSQGSNEASVQLADVGNAEEDEDVKPADADVDNGDEEDE